jgi:transposase
MVEQLADGYEFLQQDPKDIHRIIVLHKECNTPSSITIVNFKNGQRCTKCKRINNFKKLIYDLVGDEYLLLNYEASPKKSVFLHNDPNCLKEINISNTNFLKLRHCTECGKDKNHNYESPYTRKPIDLRSHHTVEFKQQIVDAYHNGKRKCDIIREYNINDSSLDRWIARLDNATDTSS